MLILVEGVPGAGKSSTARFPRDALAAEGRAVRWWYEEERGHPVYCFHDAATLAAVVADLNAGQHERVIAAALARWRRFAAETRTSDTVVILDGCLFGYLTWSLFPLAVPEAEIAAYVAAVERILAPCAPRLIYLRPSDLAATLAHVGRERGDGWLSRFTARATDNALARRHGWRGVEGMLAYWTAYRDLADRLFERSSLPRMAVAGAGEAWPEVRRALAAFLGLAAPDTAPVVDPRRYVGRYVEVDGDRPAACEVRAEAGGLVAHGLPGLWPRNRLIARGGDVFAVESLPFEVVFAVDASGTARTLTLAGRDLLTEPAGAARVFVRVGAA